MSDEQWNEGAARSIGVYLNGDAIDLPGPRGERITDDRFLMLFNAHHETIGFTIPTREWGDEWAAVIDTAEPSLEEGARVFKAGEEVPVDGRAVVVLKRVA